MTAPVQVTESGLMHTSRRGSADQVFARLTSGAGILVLLLLAAITVFLVVESIPALRADRVNFFTSSVWDPDTTGRFGIAALAFGTVLSSGLALVFAVPVAFGVALYVAEYAPPRLATPLGYLTDLLAAIPSVVYGLWGLYFLLPRLVPVQEFLNARLSVIPLFAGHARDVAHVSKSVFGAAVVLAIMILPIMAAIMREVLRQADDSVREAALALGATRWETIRLAVLPPSRPGLVSAVMLGLGRALGETIAVALLIGNVFTISWQVLTPGGNTIAANIANRFGDAGPMGRSALIASGLVLFAITLLVNLAARAVIYRAGQRERSALV